MELKRLLYKRDKLKKRADDLDKWLENQINQSKEDRKHHLSMPYDPSFIGDIKYLIEKIREEQFEIEDKIEKIEDDRKYIKKVLVSSEHSDEDKLHQITTVFFDQ